MRWINATLRNKAGRLVLVGLCCHVLGGCVTNAAKPASDLDDDGLVVVQRSKAEPPVWVKWPTGQVVDAPAELRVMTARSKLLNLPLGLRQTQLVGMDVARSALAAWLSQQLLAQASAEPDSAAAKQELARVVRATLDGSAGGKAKINDLYYEALTNHEAPPGDLMAHYYAVYILVAYPKDKLPFLFHDLSTRLRSSSQPYTQRLAAVATALERRSW